MSVIVMGMEMPKNCAECERWSICKCLNDYEDYESILYAVEDGDLVKADGCPLVEIPTPHGRLIDADEFEREFNNHLLPILVKKYGEEEALKGLHFSFRDCICNIQCQKTVIEGSEE